MMSQVKYWPVAQVRTPQTPMCGRALWVRWFPIPQNTEICCMSFQTEFLLLTESSIVAPCYDIWEPLY